MVEIGLRFSDRAASVVLGIVFLASAELHDFANDYVRVVAASESALGISPIVLGLALVAGPLAASRFLASFAEVTWCFR